MAIPSLKIPSLKIPSLNYTMISAFFFAASSLLNTINE
jgi:hypothetical protein